MLQVFIKHFIYDFCIKVFFDKIKANFRTVALHRLPRVGEFLSKISHRYDDEHYYNCVIKSTQKQTNDQKETYYIVELNYQYSDGSVFEGVDVHSSDDDEYEEEMEEKEEFDQYFEKDDYELLSDGEIDAIERKNGLSIRYERYNFFR